MRRTLVDLDAQLWNVSHVCAGPKQTTIRNREQRMKAMRGVVGIRKATLDEPDAVKQVENLRRGSRRSQALSG